MLKQRIITAIILIPLVLIILFFLSPAAFFILTAIMTLGAAWEWSNLMQLKKIASRLLYLLIVLFAAINSYRIPMMTFFVCAFIWWLIATILILFYPRGSRWWSNSIVWRGLMGLLVLVPCFRAINFIRQNSMIGIYTLLFLFVLIWGADSVAYFVGKKWGKTKLAPLVSPGKSWQGLTGALVSSILIALLASWLMHVPLYALPWGIALSLITVLFSVVGDLFESMLKRQAGLKDSGKLLPGHGGLLDRIDSLTAAAPVFSLGIILLGKYLA